MENASSLSAAHGEERETESDFEKFLLCTSLQLPWSHLTANDDSKEAARTSTHNRKKWFDTERVNGIRALGTYKLQSCSQWRRREQMNRLRTSARVEAECSKCRFDVNSQLLKVLCSACSVYSFLAWFLSKRLKTTCVFFFFPLFFVYIFNNECFCAQLIFQLQFLNHQI